MLTRTCEVCGGSGFIGPGEFARSCQRCNRTGRVPENAPRQCCDDPTPAEHEGRRYCQCCDADLVVA